METYLLIGALVLFIIFILSMVYIAERKMARVDKELDLLKREAAGFNKHISRLYLHINEINGGPVALPGDQPDPNIWVDRLDTNTFTDGKP